MMAPLPNPTPPDRPELPRVRLEARTGSGRTVSYEVGGDEFLIGGAPGCDLRLPLPGQPPVVCQLTRKADGLRVRRHAPGVVVLLNGHPLPANTALAVSHGDRLTVADIEITVAVQTLGFVRPKLIAVDEPALPPPPRSEVESRTVELAAEEFARREEWNRRDSELVRRQRDLDTQTEELESDRMLWYRRRQEMEREFAEIESARRSLAPRHAELDNREQELSQVRGELAELREQLTRLYQNRIGQLNRTQEAAHEATACLRAEREAFDAEQQHRREEIEAEATRRLRETDEEIARRRSAFDAEVAGFQPRFVELRSERERIAVEFQSLSRQRDAFAADRDIFEKARATFEAERVAEAERLADWDAALAARDADLPRRESQVRTDRESLDRDRAQLHEDLLRLSRREAVAEERDRDHDRRTQELGARLERLREDAAEWEATVTLAAAEQDRLRTEAERLDRQKAELDAQSAKLAERAGQLESQQAVLAVLRAKLDRTREEAEREATALAAARAREEESQQELRDRIREAEQLRAELDTVQENTAQERRRLDERDSLLSAGLAEIRVQQESLAADESRLRQREGELDVRSAEFAEQAGSLKGRMSQALDLRSRLEADRVAIREREAALSQAEEARQTLQEQLRRRAEELANRAKALDELAKQLTADRAALEQQRAASDTERAATLEELTARQAEVLARGVEIDRQAVAFAEREGAMARQVARLKEVGQAVAAERKSLQDARTKWEAERTAAEAVARQSREELEAFRARVAAEIDALRAEAPELDGRAKDSLDRLGTVRDMLRGHLSELNDFARVSRSELDAARTQLRDEAATLDQARAEHRLAVAAFRQQLVEWQGRVGEMRRGLAQGESRIEAKQTAADESARQAEAATRQLAEQADRLRRERDEVAQRRIEVERHLTDMREWYRRKLRELARANAERGEGNAEPEPPALMRPRLADTGDISAFNELEPGDRQLGELLRSLELVDTETLALLWAEAGRQRRTLRQVLLTSGVVTLYQLALIEAGNLDALMLGRFRVIDRLRATPREAMYRVFDPGRAGGVFLLRHLAEAEMQDAVHPDEFRQRFAAARDAAHPNLAVVADVVELNGRPAALLEWLSGLFSGDWPAQVAHPGCWVRLVTMAAEGIEAAHRAGLVHGRLTSDSFVLTAGGVLKVTGVGEPPWLETGSVPFIDPTPGTDLRALGQVSFGWSRLGEKKRGAKPKPFPAELAAVVRRLEADAESPMGDTVAADRPYDSAAELVADLRQVARATPFSDDAWEKLLRFVAENAPDGPAALRQSA